MAGMYHVELSNTENEQPGCKFNNMDELMHGDGRKKKWIYDKGLFLIENTHILKMYLLYKNR